MHYRNLTLIILYCLAVLLPVSGQLSGGLVTTEDGDTLVYTCPGDGMEDIVTFDSSGVDLEGGAAFAYLITDDNNEILGLPPGDMANLEEAGTGVCRVWGLAYTGTLQLVVGDNIDDGGLSDMDWDLSDNFISVVREVPEGGRVTTEAGDTVVYTCPGDGMDDIVRLDSSGSSAANFTYVVTDDQNMILAIPGGDMVNLEGAGPGVCRIWGLSYTGNLTAMMGDDAASVALSDDCFDLSDNFVTTIREVPEGGMVTTDGGMDTVYTCAGDGMDDIVMLDSSGTSAAKFTYVVTDDQNTILAIPGGDMINLEGAGPGVCRVWGLSYTGNLTAMMGDDAASVALSDDCFDLSDNFVTTIRTEVAAGRVTTQAGDTIVYSCPGDGMDDFIQFDSVGASANASFAYVVTDDQNNILGLPPGDRVNFEGAGRGVCRVWGLSYTGNITAMMGDNAAMVALSDSCFVLSDNFVTVVRDTVGGGMVMTEGGKDTVYTCAGDGLDDIVVFDSTGTSNAKFTYVITDDQNIILGLPPGDAQNFEGAGPGVCRVWGLSYTGNITAMAGDDAASVMLSDDCFDLSANFITVIRSAVNAGRVTTQAGDTLVYTCPGDGIEDFIQFDSIGASESARFAYVVTDDQNVILGLPPGDRVNFEGAGVGLCRVWGLSYTGNITAMMGDNAAMVALSDSCFVLSDNFVTVVRDTVEGGMVSAENGQDTIFTCSNDGLDDVYAFDSTGTSDSKFAYVVTDDQNVILGLPPGDRVNFEPAGAGICRVWGLSYTGEITASPGDDASMVDLTDDCFELSSNFITVIREDDGEACQVTNTVQLSDKNTLRVFPNPVSDQLQIRWSKYKGTGQVTATVSDLQGRVILQRVLPAGADLTLRVADLPAGIFILSLRDSTAVGSVRILKQ